MKCTDTLNELPQLRLAEFGAAHGAEERRERSQHLFIRGQIGREFMPGERRGVEECLLGRAAHSEEFGPIFEDRDVLRSWIDATFELALVVGVDVKLFTVLSQREFLANAQVFQLFAKGHDRGLGYVW